MTDEQLAIIHRHVADIWRDYNKMMHALEIYVLYEPRNPFNFRTEHEFYIAWRTEWRRVVAEHIAQSAPNESELRDLGLKN